MHAVRRIADRSKFVIDADIHDDGVALGLTKTRRRHTIVSGHDFNQCVSRVDCRHRAGELIERQTVEVKIAADCEALHIIAAGLIRTVAECLPLYLRRLGRRSTRCQSESHG